MCDNCMYGQASVMVLEGNSTRNHEVGEVPSLMGCYTSFVFCFTFQIHGIKDVESSKL